MALRIKSVRLVRSPSGETVVGPVEGRIEVVPFVHEGVPGYLQTGPEGLIRFFPAANVSEVMLSSDDEPPAPTTKRSK